MHDMSYFDRSVPADVGETYRKSLGKDMFERAKNPLQKNAKGIRFAQETIILSTFSKMKQRDISKENNDTEVEQDQFINKKNILCFAELCGVLS